MYKESNIYMHRNCFITDRGYLVGLREMIGMCVQVCLLTGISPDNYMVKSCFATTDLDHARKGTDRFFKILILLCHTQDYFFKSFVTLVAVLFLLFKVFTDKF